MTLGIAISPDGRWLASTRASDSIVLVDLTTGKNRKLVAKVGDNHLEVLLFKPCFSHDSRLVTAGNLAPDDGASPIWDVKTGKQRCVFSFWNRVGAGAAAMHVLFDKKADLLYGVLSPWMDAHQIAAFDTGTGVIRFQSFVRQRERWNSPIHSLDHGGVMVDNEGALDVWAPLGPTENTPKNPIQQVPSKYDLSVAPSGKWGLLWTKTQWARVDIGSAGTDMKVRPKLSLRKLPVDIRDLAWLPGYDRVLLAGVDGNAAILDLRNGRAEKWMAGNRRPLRGVAVAPNGRRVYTQKVLGIVVEWQTTGLRRIRTLVK